MSEVLDFAVAMSITFGIAFFPFTFPISAMNTNSDPYAHLSHLCGVAAFSLPPRPLLLLSLPPHPRPPADHFGPIPHHLLSRYLCYDAPSPELLSSSSSIPYSPSATATHPSPQPLLLHSPSLCPNFTPHDSPLPSPDITASLANVASSPQLPPPPPFNCSDSITAAAPHSETMLHESLISCNLDSPRHMDSPVQRREILPPCVVNYQDTLCFTPERETCPYSASVLGVGVSDGENRIPSLLPTSEIDEMALCDSNYVLAPYLVSVMKDSAFTGWYGKRMRSLVKKSALWRKDEVTLDGKESEKVASFVKFSFSTRGRENSLQEPSRKKQRKHEAKSKGMISSSYFTRSKSANRSS